MRTVSASKEANQRCNDDIVDGMRKTTDRGVYLLFPLQVTDGFSSCSGTIYDQLSILNPDYSLNKTALDEQGLPW